MLLRALASVKIHQGVRQGMPAQSTKTGTKGRLISTQASCTALQQQRLSPRLPLSTTQLLWCCNSLGWLALLSAVVPLEQSPLTVTVRMHADPGTQKLSKVPPPPYPSYLSLCRAPSG